MEKFVYQTSKSFDGKVKYFKHSSESTATSMTFGVYEPEKVENRIPMLWLSGLTCTHENFLTKAAALKYASDNGILLIAPDTSPRGAGVPGEDQDWDFGTGAGFYVNATKEPWSKHYRMYDYILLELLPMVLNQYGFSGRKIPILGHSMGGHGAVMLGLRNPDKFCSISAFAPILNPSNAPWGIKAFNGYLGTNRAQWKDYDSTALVAAGVGAEQPLLIDQGAADPYLQEELCLETFRKSCADAGREVEIKIREGFDHGYYYISTFIEEHLSWHAEKFQAAA